MIKLNLIFWRHGVKFVSGSQNVIIVNTEPELLSKTKLKYFQNKVSTSGSELGQKCFLIYRSKEFWNREWMCFRVECCHNVVNKKRRHRSRVEEEPSGSRQSRGLFGFKNWFLTAITETQRSINGKMTQSRLWAWGIPQPWLWTLTQYMGSESLLRAF